MHDKQFKTFVPSTCIILQCTEGYVPNSYSHNKGSSEFAVLIVVLAEYLAKAYYKITLVTHFRAHHLYWSSNSINLHLPLTLLATTVTIVRQLWIRSYQSKDIHSSSKLFSLIPDNLSGQSHVNTWPNHAGMDNHDSTILSMMQVRSK